MQLGESPASTSTGGPRVRLPPARPRVRPGRDRTARPASHPRGRCEGGHVDPRRGARTSSSCRTASPWTRRQRLADRRRPAAGVQVPPRRQADARARARPRIGGWDATHFNQPTDMRSEPDGTFYVSDGYVNSRVALFDTSGKVAARVGQEGSGQGEFSNPHGLALLPAAPTCSLPIARTRGMQLFDRDGAFKRQWAGRRTPIRPGACLQWLSMQPARCLSASGGRTTTEAHRRAEAGSRVDRDRPRSGSASQAIRCSTPCTTSRSVSTARSTSPKRAPSASSSFVRSIRLLLDDDVHDVQAVEQALIEGALPHSIEQGYG